MTWDRDNKNLFVWKAGRRVSIGEGASSGAVSGVEVLGSNAVKFCGVKGNTTWRLRMSLTKMQVDANEFMKQLGVHHENPDGFCRALRDLTDGVVEYIGSNKMNEEQVKEKQPMKRGEVHTMASSMDQDIAKHLIGVFEIPVEHLRDAPVSARIRDVKEWYVDYLVGEMEQDTGDKEELTPPFVVTASCTKEEFHVRSLNSYTFDVIGGVHHFRAIAKINAEKKKIYSRRCAVYGAGLSRNAILHLSNQHNEVNKMLRATSFPEVASSCRRLLFVHFGEGMEDDGEQMPVVPHYNTHKYRAWKTECSTYLTAPGTSSALIETALQMALQPSKVYHKMQEVFLLFEQGKLKGQQELKLSGAGLQKALQGKNCAKLYHFKMFQGLADADKMSPETYHQAQAVALVCCKPTDISPAVVPQKNYNLIVLTAQEGWMAADVAYALKKAMGCNTAENALIVVLNMMPESDLTDALEKVGQMCGKDITSKTVSLATPVDDDVVFGVAHTTLVSLSHIGSGDAPQYVKDSTCGFICQKRDSEEFPLALSTGQDWLEYVLQMVPRGGTILDMYGSHGEIIHTATSCGHDVFALAITETTLESIRDNLEKYDDTQLQSIDTQQQGSTKRKSKTPLNPPAPKKGKYLTRSGANVPGWSKSLDPNNPLDL